MTFTLICIIAYLFTWAYQNISKKIKAENKKRTNKTNPLLQAKLRAQFQIKVSKEWEALKSSHSTEHEKLHYLYRKFHIPLHDELKDTPLQSRLSEDSLSELVRALTMRAMHRLGYKFFFGTPLSPPSLREKICNKNPLRLNYPWL